MRVAGVDNVADKPSRAPIDQVVGGLCELEVEPLRKSVRVLGEAYSWMRQALH